MDQVGEGQAGAGTAGTTACEGRRGASPAMEDEAELVAARETQMEEMCGCGSRWQS